MLNRRTWVAGLAAAVASGAFAAPARPDPESEERIQEVRKAVQAWQLAWELGDFDNYLRFYDPAFRGDLGSRKQWERQRRERLARKDIGLEVEDVQVKLVGRNQADVRFVQRYTSPEHSDVGEKRLRLRRVQGAWKITRESWRAKR